MESSGLTRKACQIREKGLGLRRLRELITFFILVIIIHPIVIGDCQIGNKKESFKKRSNCQSQCRFGAEFTLTNAPC